MGLSRVERARISDSRLRIKSVEHSLKHVDPKKVENYDAIQECLENADESLTKALDEASNSENA